MCSWLQRIVISFVVSEACIHLTLQHLMNALCSCINYISLRVTYIRCTSHAGKCAPLSHLLWIRNLEGGISCSLSLIDLTAAWFCSLFNEILHYLGQMYVMPWKMTNVNKGFIDLSSNCSPSGNDPGLRASWKVREVRLNKNFVSMTANISMSGMVIEISDSSLKNAFCTLQASICKKEKKILFE